MYKAVAVHYMLHSHEASMFLHCPPVCVGFCHHWFLQSVAIGHCAQPLSAAVSTCCEDVL